MLKDRVWVQLSSRNRTQGYGGRPDALYACPVLYVVYSVEPPLEKNILALLGAPGKLLASAVPLVA